MKLIGLTGGSGSGKTTAAQYFSDCGVSVIDADAVARTVVLPGSRILTKIKSVFGAEYINDDGTLNRSKLGRLVFSDTRQLDCLNGIMVPAILSEIEKKICELRLVGTAVAVLDAPLLFEYRLDEVCDVVVLMKTPLSVRLDRLVRRDGLSETELMQRIASQADFDALSARADYLLDATDAACLRCEVKRILDEIKEATVCD